MNQELRKITKSLSVIEEKIETLKAERLKLYVRRAEIDTEYCSSCGKNLAKPEYDGICQDCWS